MTNLDLDEFCRTNGFTIDALARELDVSRATIFNWKKDSRGLPRLVQLALHALRMDKSLHKTEKRNLLLPAKQYRRGSYSPLELDGAKEKQL